MTRAAGIVFGVTVHLLFGVTVWQLVHFLAGHSPVDHSDSPLISLAINSALATQFAVSHSLLLYPSVRERLTNGLIPAPFYGCFYCLATCVSLCGLFRGWKTSPIVLYEFAGWSRSVVWGAFVFSWLGLLHSLHLTGLGWQTGLTPWLAWVRGQPAPRRGFQPRSSYRLLRHPVYLSFLGLVWFCPVLTLDRAMLIAIWTVYIFVGSWLKDRRLEYFLGDSYRQYQAHVPGYPLVPFGPLARIPLPAMKVKNQSEMVGADSRVVLKFAPSSSPSVVGTIRPEVANTKAA